MSRKRTSVQSVALADREKKMKLMEKAVGAGACGGMFKTRSPTKGICVDCMIEKMRIGTMIIAPQFYAGRDES